MHHYVPVQLLSRLWRYVEIHEHKLYLPSYIFVIFQKEALIVSSRHAYCTGVHPMPFLALFLCLHHFFVLIASSVQNKRGRPRFTILHQSKGKIFLHLEFWDSGCKFPWWTFRTRTPWQILKERSQSFSYHFSCLSMLVDTGIIYFPLHFCVLENWMAAIKAWEQGYTHTPNTKACCLTLEIKSMLWGKKRKRVEPRIVGVGGCPAVVA